MKGWRNIKIGDIAEFRNGLNYNKESFGKGLKVINVGDFKDYFFPKYELLSEINLNKNVSKDALLKDEDILFVRSNGNKNLIGRSLYIQDIKEEVAYSAFCIRLRFNELKDISSKFFLYYFKSSALRQTLSVYGNGTNISNLNQEILTNLKVDIPSLEVQNKIASILSNYDHLIENNNRRIAILEEMAAEIYKEWFVRLRFPNWKETKVVDGIPEGWEIESLDKVSENYSRKRKPLSTMVRKEIQGVYPYYGAAKIIDYIDDYIFEGRYLLLAEDGSVITSNGNPVLQLVNGKFWVSNHAHVLQGKGEISLNYLYLFLNKYPIISHVTGAAQPKINKENLNRIKVLRPLKEISIQFNNLVNPIFDEIEVLKKKNNNLQKTRDLLLPRLVSGKLSVEHLVECRQLKQSQRD